MKRKGIGAAFSDEELELMRTLWLEEGQRQAKAGRRPAPPGRPGKPRAVEAPDRRTVSKKESGADGASPEK